MLKAIHNMSKRNKKGFTLIELLIVIAIIAILAAIAIPQFGAYRSRAVRAGMVADSKNVATTIETLFQDCNTYAQSLTAKATGPAALNLNVGGACANAANPTNANVSKNNEVEITAATALAWTMTVTNAGGDDATYTGPITRKSDGSCSWKVGGSC